MSVRVAVSMKVREGRYKVGVQDRGSIKVLTKGGRILFAGGEKRKCCCPGRGKYTKEEKLEKDSRPSRKGVLLRKGSHKGRLEREGKPWVVTRPILSAYAGREKEPHNLM